MAVKIRKSFGLEHLVVKILLNAGFSEVIGFLLVVRSPLVCTLIGILLNFLD